jgi:hypothetical protein
MLLLNHKQGHPKHEYTSGVAIEFVFEFLQDRSEEEYSKKVTDKENETNEQPSVANNEGRVTKTVYESNCNKHSKLRILIQ